MYKNIHPYSIIAGLVCFIGFLFVIRNPLMSLVGAVIIFYGVDAGIKLADRSER